MSRFITNMTACVVYDVGEEFFNGVETLENVKDILYWEDPDELQIKYLDGSYVNYEKVNCMWVKKKK